MIASATSFLRRRSMRCAQVPGVTAAAFTSQLPLSGDSDVYGAKFEGDDPEVGYPVYRYAVTPGYFEALNIPLRRGRLLDDHDTTNTPPVMLISESLAKRRFPNQDPIGKRVHVGGRIDSPMFTIVGVVGDVRQMSLALGDTDAVYATTTQWHWADGTLSLVVRAHGNAAEFVPAIKNAIWSVDRDQPIVRVAMMDDLLAASAAERRFVLILFEAFGVVALMLAATRDLWSSVRQRFGANPGNRGSLGAGCLAPWHPRAGAASGDDPHRVRHPDRTRRSMARERAPSAPCCSMFHVSIHSRIWE